VAKGKDENRSKILKFEVHEKEKRKPRLKILKFKAYEKRKEKNLI
jgi:hypothetical protein